ncbi:MAG: NADP-dependent malic enzyme [Patescibacteria group bacterium]
MPKKTVQELSLQLHKKLHGKIAIAPKVRLKTLRDLSISYTPGVAAASSYLALHKDEVRHYTMKGNAIAVVSDGSAVLGLGNIGPEGALPVMEGKALIFKEFANIDAFPIVLATQDSDEIIAAVRAIAPTFGGINLEDIAAPRCFEIERQLQESLDIPVVHDDQHGTAVVVLAGLLNALKVVKKKLHTVRIVLSGAGAAGSAIADILLKKGVGDIVMVDSKGIVSLSRSDLDSHKLELAARTNVRKLQGGLAEAFVGADVAIGVSKAGLFTEAHIRSMNAEPIIFAMANPTPEIMPREALRAGAAIIATGRSDFPNQVNNALVFPGLFRGALDHGVRRVTDAMFIRAAEKLAALVPHPTRERIVPSIFDTRVVKAVSSAISLK